MPQKYQINPYSPKKVNKEDLGCRYQLPGDSAWAAAKLDFIRTMNKMH